MEICRVLERRFCGGASLALDFWLLLCSFGSPVYSIPFCVSVVPPPLYSLFSLVFWSMQIYIRFPIITLAVCVQMWFLLLPLGTTQTPSRKLSQVCCLSFVLIFHAFNFLHKHLKNAVLWKRWQLPVSLLWNMAVAVHLWKRLQNCLLCALKKCSIFFFTEEVGKGLASRKHSSKWNVLPLVTLA